MQQRVYMYKHVFIVWGLSYISIQLCILADSTVGSGIYISNSLVWPTHSSSAAKSVACTQPRKPCWYGQNVQTGSWWKQQCASLCSLSMHFQSLVKWANSQLVHVCGGVFTCYIHVHVHVVYIYGDYIYVLLNDWGAILQAWIVIQCFPSPAPK